VSGRRRSQFVRFRTWEHLFISNSSTSPADERTHQTRLRFKSLFSHVLASGPRILFLRMTATVVLTMLPFLYIALLFAPVPDTLLAHFRTKIKRRPTEGPCHARPVPHRALHRIRPIGLPALLRRRSLYLHHFR